MKASIYADNTVLTQIAKETHEHWTIVADYLDYHVRGRIADVELFCELGLWS